MQILLPMAGNGSRFQQKGFTDPKPLIDVMGRPMIDRVIENLGYDNKYTFVVRKEHYIGNEQRFHTIFRQTGGQFAVYKLDEVTDGAARTCLKAKHLIKLDEPLIIANCDQIMNWDAHAFYNTFMTTECDGMILTFYSDNVAHSYVRLDSNFKYITEVAEKIVISDKATVGIYAWKRAGDFFDSIEEMISRNIRTNGEFYVAPAFNMAIEKGMKFLPYRIPSHYPVGTPEQLEDYIEAITCH